jgi:hypothetical protein
MTYQGGCHCGQIGFEVEGDIERVIECNCSICSKRGSRLWFVPRQQLRLQTPEQDLSTYTFHTHEIKHRFCARCGIHTFGEGTTPSGHAMAAVNARCLEGVDWSKVSIEHFDGRSL